MDVLFLKVNAESMLGSTTLLTCKPLMETVIEIEIGQSRRFPEGAGGGKTSFVFKE